MSLRHLNIGQILLFFFASILSRGQSIHKVRIRSKLNFEKIRACIVQIQIIEGRRCNAADYSVFLPPTHLLCMHTNGITKIANEIVQDDK